MGNTNFLWADMRLDESNRSYYDDFLMLYQGRKFEREIPDSTVTASKPTFVCFDYDFPEEKNLTALLQFKARHPSIPIIMFTVYHSERLMIWALRARVWDFIVKPFNIIDVVPRIEPLTQIHERRQEPRLNLFPALEAPAPGSFLSVSKQRSFPAVQFIKANYGQKITVDILASICHQSTSSFSRTFKREQGVGVSDFLMSYRLEKAQALLVFERRSVSDTAYAVGFNDVSYFCRVFRRCVGVSPTTYLRVVPQNIDGVSDTNLTGSPNDRYGAATTL